MSIQQSGSYANPRLDLGIPLMEFMQSNDEFIGLKVAPLIGVDRKAAVYPAITRESLIRTSDVKRAARSAYNRDSFETEDKEYSCKEYGSEQAIDDSERAFYKNDFDAAKLATMTAGRRILQAQEQRIADAVMNTTTFTGAALYTDNSGSPWATIGTDIKSQVLTAKEAVRTNCGMEANSLIINKPTLNSLLKNTAIIEAVKYTRLATVKEITDALAAYFDLDQILVGKGVKNSAKEGQTFSKTDIWSSTYAMVALLAKSNDLSEPALMRTFNWEQDGSAAGIVVEEYREEQTRSNVYRARHSVDEEVIDAYFGHLLKIA
jgi:hypothetical protein